MVGRMTKREGSEETWKGEDGGIRIDSQAIYYGVPNARCRRENIQQRYRAPWAHQGIVFHEVDRALPKKQTNKQGAPMGASCQTLGLSWDTPYSPET